MIAIGRQKVIMKHGSAIAATGGEAGVLFKTSGSPQKNYFKKIYTEEPMINGMKNAAMLILIRMLREMINVSLGRGRKWTDWKKSSPHLPAPIGLLDSFPALNQRKYVRWASLNPETPPIREVTIARFFWASRCAPHRSERKRISGRRPLSTKRSMSQMETIRLRVGVSIV